MISRSCHCELYEHVSIQVNFNEYTRLHFNFEKYIIRTQIYYITVIEIWRCHQSMMLQCMVISVNDVILKVEHEKYSQYFLYCLIYIVLRIMTSFPHLLIFVCNQQVVSNDSVDNHNCMLWINSIVSLFSSFIP